MSRVDKDIVAHLGDFRFNEQVAKNFDSHVRKSVPFYDEIQRMITEMSDYFIHKDSIIYDLGCSTGETIANLWSKHRVAKRPQFIGIDESEAMLDVARERLKGYSNVILYSHDLNTPTCLKDASLVTMLYTLQFVKPENRLRLTKEVYNGLHDAGALIMVEKITGTNIKFNEIWIELYHDMKLRNGLSLEQIKAKSDSLRGVLFPYSLERNIQLLNDAGFRDVDVFFKWYNFVGMIAIK